MVEGDHLEYGNGEGSALGNGDAKVLYLDWYVSVKKSIIASVFNNIFLLINKNTK